MEEPQRTQQDALLVFLNSTGEIVMHTQVDADDQPTYTLPCLPNTGFEGAMQAIRKCVPFGSPTERGGRITVKCCYAPRFVAPRRSAPRILRNSLPQRILCGPHVDSTMRM